MKIPNIIWTWLAEVSKLTSAHVAGTSVILVVGFIGGFVFSPSATALDQPNVCQQVHFANSVQ